MVVEKDMQKYWWDNQNNLPERTPDEVEEVYQHLIESLFHMPDDLANLLKQAFIKKYPFIDVDRIKNW